MERDLKMRNKSTRVLSKSCWLLAFLVTAILSILINYDLVAAQVEDTEDPKVQIISGRIDPETIAVYRLAGLQQGQTLYTYMENTAGNLDPFLMLFPSEANAGEIAASFSEQINKAIAEGEDPLISLPVIFDQLSLAWNDDSQERFDASFEYLVPADGSYLLLVSGAPATKSFGSYRLMIGLDAPEVLNGVANSTGDTIAVLDPTVSIAGTAVQEIHGTITAEEPEQSVTFRPLKRGETLYFYVEALSGDLTPVLVLRSFNGKPLLSNNLNGEQTTAIGQYTVERDVSNYSFSVTNQTLDNDQTTGSYRMLLGINAPEVLSGNAQVTEFEVLDKALEVQLGTKLVQITGIDQLNERFNAVAELRMDWHDPDLAFNPEDCQCKFQTFTGDSFIQFAEENEITWPEFTLINQQGNRWIQNRNLVISPDGEVIYFERFTTDFQAPLFDFRKFPFDHQDLFIEVASLFPEDFVAYIEGSEFSAIGDMLGEEEWFVVSSDTEISKEEGNYTYQLQFSVRRHLNFYVFRIFLPIILVIVVSWISLFLKDYGKRVDVASANLLVFVAFNFTIGDDLPRLGYLTFMDAVLIGTFVVSILVVIYNVYLRRLEINGRRDFAEKIDHPMTWIYPLLYAVGALVAVLIFLV
jgi:hypothetical protein